MEINNKTEQKNNTTLSDEDIKKEIEEIKDVKNTFCCSIFGDDGTGKTGLVMDYCSKLPKQTMFIDVDLGCKPIKDNFYKDNKKIIVPNMYKSVTSIVNGKEVLDSNLLLSRVNSYIRYTINNEKDYSAIVFDGLSSFLTYCEKTMKMEKFMTIEGGVNANYWRRRNELFLGTIDLIKGMQIDRFFIGHADFIKPKILVKITDGMGIERTKDFPKIKEDMWIRSFQIIICKKDEGKYTAMIDKSKFNDGGMKEFEEYVFGEKTKDEFIWNTKGIFEGFL